MLGKKMRLNHGTDIVINGKMHFLNLCHSQKKITPAPAMLGVPLHTTATNMPMMPLRSDNAADMLMMRLRSDNAASRVVVRI